MTTFKQFFEMAKDAKIKPGIKSKMNNEIGAIAGKYYDAIPLQGIVDVLKKYGYKIVQEDGTDWSGMLLGGKECGHPEAAKQRANISIAQQDGILTQNTLLLMWCKMPSGRYEIVSYIS